MRSTFFGIDIGRRALQTQQRALDVMGHNIANANTPGYSRQVAIQATTQPYTLPSRHMPVAAGQVGTGVYVAAIKRVRDEFIDMQLRNETESAGRSVNPPRCVAAGGAHLSRAVGPELAQHHGPILAVASGSASTSGERCRPGGSFVSGPCH